jgi:hypothetical protein
MMAVLNPSAREYLAMRTRELHFEFTDWQMLEFVSSFPAAVSF